MTDNTVLLEDDVLVAAIELRDIARARRDLEAREKAAKEVLAKHLATGETGVDPAGNPLVTVRAGARRFDPAAATANLPPEVLATISVTAPDGKRAKEILAPALYDLCTKQNAPSVVAL